MSTISELLIKIGADSSGLRKELDASKQSINKTFGDVQPLNEMQGALTSTTGKVEQLVGSFTKFAGVVAGGFGLTSLISGAVTAGESIYQLSQKMGVTVAEAGEFKRVLALTGGDADSASMAIMRLDKTISSGGNSAKQAQAIFDALGVSLKDQNGHLLPLNQQLEQLATGYKKAEQAGYGQEFIMNTLGAKGMSLTQTLRDYAEAKENAAKVKSSGMIDAEQMHQLDQEMKVINLQLGQLKVAGGAALAPLAEEILPSVLSGLSKAAVFIKENSTQIKVLTTDLVKLYAAYKSIQAIRAISNKVGDAVKTTIGKNTEVAAEEKAQAELTKVQERAIKKRETAMEKAANNEIKEYEKTVKQMEISEAEKTRLVTEYSTQRVIALEEAQAKERAAMEKLFLEYQAQKTREVEIAAESEQAKATAAEKAATQIADANTVAAASAEKIVVSNGEAAASEAAKADAAAVASERIVRANEVSQAATVESTVKQEALTAAEVVTGNAAGETATKKVTAETISQNATAASTVKQEALTAATVVTGNVAVETSTKTVSAAAAATGAVRTLTGAVWALAGGWWGVAAAIAYVLYLSSQRSTAAVNSVNGNFITLDDGTTVTTDANGNPVGVKDVNSERAAAYGDATNTGDDYDPGAGGGDNSNSSYAGEDGEGDGYGDYSSVTGNSYGSGSSAPADNHFELSDDQVAEFKQKKYNYWLATTPEGQAEMRRQQENAIKEKTDAENQKMMDLLKNINIGGGGGGASGGGGGSGSGGSSSAASTAQATPMRTAYSFENDDELAQWANEIEYAAKYWGIDPIVLASIIKKESHGQADAWSSDHAHYGLGQISQDIANTYANGQGYGAGSDPNMNIWAAAAYLADLTQQYGGDYEKAISAYNLGHADVGANWSYVSDVENYMSQMSSTQVPLTGSTAQAQAQPVAYDIPVGEVAAYIAANQFSDGEQWTGSLGNDIDGWCDDFTHEVYKRMFDSLGKEDPFGDGVVNDQNFRTLGAYHEATISDIAAQLHPGDLVDTPGHVGIYLGNGMVRSRQSSAGVHDLSLEDFDSTFGGIQGYGSIAEATGGMTAKSTLIGRTMTNTNKAAEEAAKKLEHAKEAAAKLSEEMSSTIFNENSTEYQKDWAKLYSDVQKKRQEINKIAAAPGIDKATIKSLEKTLDDYTDTIYQKFKKKWADAYAEFYDTTRIALDKVRRDYEDEADYEYIETVRKLNKEYDEKKKQMMHDKDDIQTLKVLSDWYYASIDEAEEKKRKAKQEAHDQYVAYLEEEGNLAMLVEYMGTPVIKADGTAEKSAGTKKGERSLDLEAERKLAKEYVKVWQAAHGSMTDYIADVSDSLYSTMTDSMTEFISDTKGAKAAIQDFGNTILNMMAKIAAQRLAGSWMSSILGIFSNSRGGTSAAWNWGGTTHSSTFGYAGVSSATKFTSSIANTANFASHLKVPGFAAGGIVTAPTLAMIGEGGEHEAVIPLNDNNLRAMGNGGKSGGVVVNITNKTDSQVSVAKSGYDEDLGKWVLDVVVDGATRDRNGFGRNLKTALKGTM
ncbi:transglycosylase SLT domain-containing protein [Mitsuokella multacida]|uniref:transglycosylase SLT domain-containing protein n=1 Tax=Mitsuokella multacida TaxID=52226 RepID=UPI002666E0CE|nr:transglycosylase SLT domain-containing protein [Mitsuokella multacida]